MSPNSWWRGIALCAALALAACGSDGSSTETNAAPLVSGASEGAIFAGSEFMLNGGGNDPEGDPLTYRWSLIRQPAGAGASIDAPTSASTEVSGTLPPGDYVFEFRVSDGENESWVNVNVTLDRLTARGIATQGRGSFDVANVDNIMIDRNGGVWFGTDGNFSTNGTADAVYFLDLEPAHATSVSPTFGQAFRIVGGPSDSEASGPAFNPDASTLFFAVQHPGEGRDSAWPADRSSAELRGRDDRPLSSVVAAAFISPLGFEGAGAPANIEEYVKAMVDELNADPAWALRNGVEFPLTNTTGDTVRTISGLRHSTVARWLDPLGDEDDAGMRFGANCDYISFFGDGWTGSPQTGGASNQGWMWVNHEYISNGNPGVGTAPSGQRLTLALFLQDAEILDFDVTDGTNWDQDAVDTFVEWHKKQLGGTWMRVVQDPTTRRWSVDRDADNIRYDATSATQLLVTGPIALENAQRDDAGSALPANVAVGLIGDCSGGTTPWGTILTAEENVQSYYGDLEDWWSSRQVFDKDGGAKAGGVITPVITASGASTFGIHSDVANQHKDRDAYGYLSEIDVGEDAGETYDAATGVGHQKLGAMGRVRWENATIVVDENFQLINGQPLTVYGANDRRGGRIYKFVSSANYTIGMTRAQIRNLLADGKLYVGHFADLDNAGGYLRNDGLDMLDTNGAAPIRGSGRWIEMSLTSTDLAPNAGASTANNATVSVLPAGATVGDALRNNTHNGIGSFDTQSNLLKMLFTAANKIGVMELNRPEDLEWNPRGYGAHGPLLFIAFTKHGRPNALDANGVLNTDITTGDQINTDTRPDSVGSIFALKEGAGSAFEFWVVHQGSNDSTPTK